MKIAIKKIKALILFLSILSLTCFGANMFVSNDVLATEKKEYFDSKNRKIKPGPYKKIISLYGAHTENLFSLGLDEEIIGVSENEDYPEQVKQKEVFNSNDSIEKFLAAEPDLVIIRPMHLASYGRLVENLEKYGIEVIALQVNQADKLYDYWRLLGWLTAREKEAEKMIVDFEAKIEQLRLRVPQNKAKPVVFMEAFHRGTKTFMEDSLPIWLLHKAGGKSVGTNITSSSNTIVAFFGLERLLSNQDRIDFYFIMNGPMNQTKPDDLKRLTVYKNIKAIKENNIFIIEESLVARPTPRLLLGLEKMIEILHSPKNKIDDL